MKPYSLVLMPHTQAFNFVLFQFCFLLCMSSPFLSHSQGVPCNGEESNGDFTLRVELVTENIGTVIDLTGNATDLSGYNTYRVYLDTEGPLDKLSAVYGDDSRPLNITSSQSFYQSPLFPGISNVLVNANNPALFYSFPDLIHDSWLTIGIDEAPNSNENETTISIIEDPVAQFSSTFASGGSIHINTANGGAWFIDNVDLYTNGNAGANQEVLVAQLTTQGEISGDLAMQVFRDGESTSENCIRPYLSFQSHGCMDDSACNYAPTAIIDDGTCDFCSCPDSLQILSASFPSDSVPAYALEVELIADHDTTGITTNILGTPNPLAGMKTYRLYAKLDNPNTRVLSGYGNTTEQLNITSTTSFYQSLFGAATPSNISPILFDIPTYADLEFDTWVTIGIDQSPNFLPPGYENITAIEDPAFNWLSDFESGNALIANTITGLAWLVNPPTSANVFPDEDLRVLIGQFTTSGTVSGTLGLQIIPFESEVGEDYRLPFSFTTEGLGDYVDILPDICTCENVDGDYLCDDVDNCSNLNACNYDDPSNGSCETLDECGTCGGSGIPAGDCDCDGNQTDALGVCGGLCATDIDGNGTCDDSEISGCMDPLADNFDSTATQDNGSCQFLGCTDSSAQNYDSGANVDDGNCEYSGCIDPLAWNYDPSANLDDGTCQANACGIDGELVVATNHAYSPSNLTISTGETVVWQNESVSLHNVNGDISTLTGLSFGNPVSFGLPNTFGNAAGTCIGSVTFSVPGVYQYDCSIGTHANLGMVGTITVGLGGCTNATASNFNGSAEYDDGTCSFEGCTDPSACNFDSNANTNDGTCEFASGCDYCSGQTDGSGSVVDNDTDDDGVCNANEILGCTDPAACNYDADPTTDSDNSLCTYADGACETCVNGVVINNDTDNDGVCDANEIPGCEDITACNYNSSATDSNGSCTYAAGCDTCSGQTDGTGTVVDNDSDDDGVCNDNEIPGCTDETACNFNPLATDEDGSCLTLDAVGICGGDCTADADSDGICDDVDDCVGDYDDCGICNGPGAIYECGCANIPAGDCDCNGNQLDALGVCGGDCTADADSDGICDDVDDCVGALDDCGICNGPGAIYECGCANIPAGDCDCNGNQLDALGVCGGDCTADADSDGICDDVDDCVGAPDDCGICNGPGAIYECGCANIPAGDCDCGGNQLDALGVCGGDCTADADSDGICDDVDDCVGALDDCGICNGPGAIYECGCSDIPEGNCDCNGNQLDALGVCGGDCTADADSDGICDDVDDCIGALDDCGICNGPGAIYECGCANIPAGDCDCSGNQLDALGVCGGDCTADADSDGICDDVDDCVGDYDDCGICNGPGAIYECGCANIPAGDCDCSGNQLDALGVCGGDCTADADSDGICDDVDDCVGALDDCGICNGPGAIYECGCANIPAGDCDCNGNQLDALGVCGGDCQTDVDGDGICDTDEIPGCTDETACNFNPLATDEDGSCLTLDAVGICGGDCTADADSDGICDDVDDCVGAPDDCGICNGPGAIYECGCANIPAGDCDCSGNQLDALGVCGGDCTADADSDGICDDVDDCVGDYDDCGICNGPGAIYECGCANIPAGDCDCSGNQLDALGVCGGDCTADADSDGICDDVDDCVGDYDDCGICNGPGAIYECGCANIPAGDCDCNGNQLDALGVCGGDCQTDVDGDGICDTDEIPGCTDETACNFNPLATDEDGSCLTLDAVGICGGDCTADADSDGICDDVDDCVGAPDDCGICNGPGAIYECGCANIPAGDCDCSGNQLDALGVCGGDCTADADSDGICDDVDDCVGEYDDCGICNGPGAIYECGCANIPAGDCDCNGNQLDALGVCGGDCTADADSDGICDDVDDCVGDYDDCGICNGPGAIYECGCANIPAGDCDCGGNQLDALGVCGGDCTADADSDGICDDVDDCVGALDDCGICNGPGAIYECGCANIPAGDCDCNGNQLDALGVCGGDCTADADSDGICDDVDDCVGDYDACGICNGPGAIYECGCSDIPEGNCDCNGNQLDALGVCGGDCAADTDGDGICDSDEIIGCTDQSACNYDPTATDDDGTCAYAGPILDCNGDCINDSDGDGICDENENECPDYNGNGICDNLDIFGCTYQDACNYDASATADNGTCTYATSGFNCDGTSIDGSSSFAGCTYPQALNYSGAANVDDGSCVFVDILNEVGPCLFDVSSDGIVNTPDLLIFLQYWESTCE